MESKAIDVVLFADRLEGTEKHYGVLFENGFILCFCCGGYIDPEDYIIIEYCDWDKVDETLRRKKMEDIYKEVYLDQYCKNCIYEKTAEKDKPCYECLNNPVNLYSHKPVNFEKK